MVSQVRVRSKTPGARLGRPAGTRGFVVRVRRVGRESLVGPRFGA